MLSCGMNKILQIFLFCLYALQPIAATAQSASHLNSSTLPISWTEWRETFIQQAIQNSIDTALVRSLLSNIEPDPRVITLDTRQPEKRLSTAEYLAQTLTKTRIKRARTAISEQTKRLKDIEEKFSVPAQYLIALWSLETDHGRNQGNFLTLRSLLTLAHEGRRADFFTQEALIMLKLIAQGKLAVDQRGSWAGAFGHVQFMPKTFAKYAKDGDGDGDIKLDKSKEDAFASAANYLSQIGWKKDERWGREVKLQQFIAPEMLGREKKRRLAEWSALGVTLLNDKPLPKREMMAGLIQPDGQGTKAYLVYNNFDMLMDWNRSVRFALSVGLLADKLSGL